MPVFTPTPLNATEGVFRAYKAMRQVHIGQVHGRGRDIKEGQVVLFDGKTVEIIPAGYTSWDSVGYAEKFYNPGFITAIEVGLFEEDLNFPTGLEVQDNGIPLSRSIDSLNFSGSNISLSVDGVDSRKINLNITGSGGGSSSSLSSGLGVYSCPVSIGVGDLVYVSGSRQIDLSDNQDTLKLPAIGIVIGKTSIDSATVAYFGEVDLFASLTPGDAYYVGPSGTITNLPSVSNSFGNSIQRIGIALSTTTLLLVMNDYIIL